MKKEIRELTSEEKKLCIFKLIHYFGFYSVFICSAFIRYNPIGAYDEDMHIIFPELYNELKDVANDLLKYNANGTRTKNQTFTTTDKAALWESNERNERIHFLEDLQAKYEESWKSEN